MTDFGRGPPSEDIEILTLKTDPPAQVTEDKQETNSVTVSWRKPLNIASNVTIEYYDWTLLNEEGMIRTKGKKASDPVHRMSLTISSLEPGMKYTFNVRVEEFDDLPKFENGLKIEVTY